MKKLFLIGFLSIFGFSFAQKKKCMEKELIFSEKEFIFYSEFNGGETKSGFHFIKNQTELDQFLGANELLAKGQEASENKIKYPKNQKVVLYNLGEFRSGNHQPKGITKIKLHQKTLEVFLKSEKKERPNSDLFYSKSEIQVISTPWMIFSVPKNFNFNNIVIKYE